MKALSILLLTGILNACAIYSGSEEKIDISTETQIHQLDGLYLNTGEPSGYLSQFIWGSAPINSDIYKEFINHRDIKYIHVISYKSSVLVQAIVNDCVAYEEKYVLGSDFEITNGEIILSSKISAITRGSDDPLVGPSYEKTSLSLDTKGDGIYKSEAVAAGLVYLLVPVAISSKSEIRFKKIMSDDIYVKCHNH